MTDAKFKSNAFEAIHSSATALHKAGAIDRDAMRSFDQSCLNAQPECETSEPIRTEEG